MGRINNSDLQGFSPIFIFYLAKANYTLYPTLHPINGTANDISRLEYPLMSCGERVRDRDLFAKNQDEFKKKKWDLG